MSQNLCIHHDHCVDGFMSAYFIWQYLKGDCEFLPAHYEQTPAPDVTGKNVYVVDFSFDRDAMLQMAEQAASIVVLDHHGTAQEKLVGLPFAKFDMGESGATMTWRFLYPDAPMPLCAQYAKDRDIWLKRLPGCDDFHVGLKSYPMKFEIWDEFFGGELANQWVDRLIIEGRILNRYIGEKLRKIAEADERGEVRIVTFEGYKVPLLNTSDLQSEIGDLLGKKYAFVMTYFDTPDKRVFSMRSRSEVNVRLLAEKYGGGGHDKASGFSLRKPSFTKSFQAKRMAVLRAKKDWKIYISKKGEIGVIPLASTGYDSLEDLDIVLGCVVRGCCEPAMRMVWLENRKVGRVCYDHRHLDPAFNADKEAVEKAKGEEA